MSVAGVAVWCCRWRGRPPCQPARGYSGRPTDGGGEKGQLGQRHQAWIELGLGLGLGSCLVSTTYSRFVQSAGRVLPCRPPPTTYRLTLCVITLYVITLYVITLYVITGAQRDAEH